MKRCFNRGGTFLLAVLETVKGCAQGVCFFEFQVYLVRAAASDGLTGAQFRGLMGNAARHGHDAHCRLMGGI